MSCLLPVQIFEEKNVFGQEWVWLCDVCSFFVLYVSTRALLN